MFFINNRSFQNAYINSKIVINGTINNVVVFKVNKTALATEITTSNAIGSTNVRWTTTSWNTFVGARTSATTVYNNIAATQAQVDSARTTLYNARIGLVIQNINLSYTGSWAYHKSSARSGYAVIYSSGTINFNTTANHVEVWMIGGGGGAGGCGTTGSGGSGGGGGGYTRNYKVGGIDGGALQVLNGDYALIVGAGGAGGQGYSQYGGSGGTTYMSQRYNGSTAWVSAAGGNGSKPNANNGGPGANGGSGGGGGQYNSNTGIGGRNGASGQAGTGTWGTNAGGAGQGRNTTIFQENGYVDNVDRGGGGSGGAHPSQDDWINSNTHGWSGTQTRNATANSGCGGGGIHYTKGNNGTAGGSGLIVIRWYD